MKKPLFLAALLAPLAVLPAFAATIVVQKSRAFRPAEINIAYRSSPLPQLDVVLNALLTTLASCGRQVVLFLDDYHAIEMPQINAFVERLTRLAPANVQFVIGSRTQPEFNLAKLRVLGDVALIHARTTYTKADDQPGAGRYTDVWARRDGRWLCVAANVTRL